MLNGAWPEGPGEDQYALDLGITDRTPVREDAWWVPALEDETEGNQDTGWWDA